MLYTVASRQQAQLAGGWWACRREYSNWPATQHAALILVLYCQVVYTGEGAAPLLRVVNASPDHPASAPGAPLAPRAREEHLVPFVREIVPAVDAGARVALLQAPPGLLELGSRRALLEGLRPQLLVRLPSKAHTYLY